MKVILAFLIGVLIGLTSFSGYIYVNQLNKARVLSERVEPEPTLSQASTSPEPSPIEPEEPSSEPPPVTSPSVRPTKSPSPTSKPSPKSSPSLSPSPSPSNIPTSTPNPTATPDVWSPPAMDPFFAQYAGQYNVDKNTLERIANCESHFNPNAVNGGYLGMFQFATSSWQSNRNLMGLDNNPALRTNIEESIKTAAFLLSRSGTSPWPSCI